MSSNSFKSATTDTKALFDTFKDGRIGELIETIIGKAELREMFDANQDFQQEPGQFEGKPSGIIALDLGIVNKDVKNALLVAQSACRSVAVLKEEAPVLPADDDVFKFVGSERDPKYLQEAQASWQLAHIIADKENAGLYAAQIFSQSAMTSVSQAAIVLKREGFEDAAVKLDALSIALEPDNVANATPNTYAGQLLEQSHLDQGTREIVEKLSDLTKNQGAIPFIRAGSAYKVDA